MALAFSKVTGSQPVLRSEGLAKVGDGMEAAADGDVHQGQARLQKEHLNLSEPNAPDLLVRGASQDFSKSLLQIGPGRSKFLQEILDAQVLASSFPDDLHRQRDELVFGCDDLRGESLDDAAGRLE
jgi:hypothetical protein